jgi:hypothetical protein
MRRTNLSELRRHCPWGWSYIRRRQGLHVARSYAQRLMEPGVRQAAAERRALDPARGGRTMRIHRPITTILIQFLRWIDRRLAGGACSGPHRPTTSRGTPQCVPATGIDAREGTTGSVEGADVGRVDRVVCGIRRTKRELSVSLRIGDQAGQRTRWPFRRSLLAGDRWLVSL